MTLSCDIGQGRVQKGSTVERSGGDRTDGYDPLPRSSQKRKDSHQLLPGYVTWNPFTIALAAMYHAFSTRPVMSGLKALPVPTLQAKTLCQRCHFPEDLSNV